MVTEGFQVAQPLGVRADGALERPSHPLVELGPARQQEILVDHLVHQRVREPIAASLAPVPDCLDEIGLDEPVERRLEGPGLGRNGTQERLVEHRPEHGRLLEQPPRIGGQPVDAREQQPVKRRRHVHCLAGRGARPAIALAHEHALAHQAADDLLDEEWIAAGPRGDEILKLRRGASTEAPNRPATSARVSSGESGASRMTDCAARATSGGLVSGRCESSSISGRSAS